MFPSPCGVSFILMSIWDVMIEAGAIQFPSPCGVSFILIINKYSEGINL